MSDKVKAAEAKFGEWYSNNHCVNVRFVGTNEDGEPVFLLSSGHSYTCDVDDELTHLPDCTGWDYQPPAPEPDTSLEASIERDKERSPSVAEGHSQTCTCVCCDRDRVWAAARKWDDLERETDKAMPKIKAMIDEAPVVTSEQPAKVRRRWKIVFRIDEEPQVISPQTPATLRKGESCVFVDEVLSDDPDPAWVDELIRLCEDYDINGVDWHRIPEHLAKRGDK